MAMVHSHLGLAHVDQSEITLVQQLATHLRARQLLALREFACAQKVRKTVARA